MLIGLTANREGLFSRLIRRNKRRANRAIAQAANSAAAMVCEPLESRFMLAGTPIYRVNAGGGAISDSPIAWSADTKSAPSPYVNATGTQNQVFSTTTTIDTTDSSIPTGTPMALFQKERWDPAGGTEMIWSFPVTTGVYEVRLYFAETYTGAQVAGARVFDVSIEGNLVLNDYDIFADVGGFKGVVKSFIVNSDASLNVAFAHVVENPAIKAIEILTVPTSADILGSSSSSLSFGTVATGQSSTQTLTLTNLGGAGDPSIIIDSTTITGTNASLFSDNFNDAGNITLAPGQTTTINVIFSPDSTGNKTANLAINHSGSNNPLNIPLAGTGGTVPIGFGKSTLTGATISSPTSLQFGPDGRLYVAQQDGTIKIFTIARTGANTYGVTATETITSVYDIVNHDDDGTVNASVVGRLVTGLLVTGTAANPVIYCVSSDPRIGAGSSGTDLHLDTNSGILSRLTWNGSTWVKLDLVRGLPRSEENHTGNGLVLDPVANKIYIAYGGNTNMGAPSNNFALLPEYALSAAILSIDLTAIGNTTYDLPTLDDETRAGNIDLNDPFGGNDGKNQAVLVSGGPVQVYSPGYRNPYDIVITVNGLMYTIDNGANAGWGGAPILDGDGNATNQISEPGVTTLDNLHLITGEGYYGGHPNPTRAWTGNTFNSANPQSPITTGNPIESQFLTPGNGDGALTTFTNSTNGLVEYTTSNFGGAMTGNLLTASFNNTIYRLVLNADGTAVTLKQALFSSVGMLPLDVTALGATGLFPGTIWVTDYLANSIVIFEPNDFDGAGGGGTGADDPNLDEDNDGYDNHDEIVNGTNPLSSADVPPDWDQDFESNLLDPDDDNDTLLDTSDPFAIDPLNGKGTNIGVSYTWENTGNPAGGLFDMGFTGLMTNGTSNYESLFSGDNITAGGAAGVFTVDTISEGTSLGVTNTQEYAFQFGVNVDSNTKVFTVHTSVLGPFSGLTPQAGQEMGLFFGNGDQDNYVKIVITSTGLSVIKEINGVVTNVASVNVSLPGPDFINLYLQVDPGAGTVLAGYSISVGGVLGPITALGTPTSIPTSWFTAATEPAVGIIGSSAGPGPVFPATWDLLEVLSGGVVQVPFVANPILVPNRFEAEYFDEGGEGLAYHDTTDTNDGGAYRPTAVDLESTTDTGGGFNVTGTKAGEWLEYTVSVPTEGLYDISVRVASLGAGGTFHIEFNGVDKTGSLSIPDTGGWQTWQTITLTNVSLSAGQQVMRLVMDTEDATTGFVGNFNWVQVGATPLPSITISATDASAAEQDTNTGTFTVTRTGSTTDSLIVNYTIGGTATHTDDYGSLTGTVTIPSGSASTTIDITPVDDALVEGDETVILTLGAGSSYTIGVPDSATVTIADNDSAPPSYTITVAATDSTAGEQAQNPGVFTVYRNGDTTNALIVYYTLTGTALNGTDYGTISGSVVIDAGQTSATVTITPIEDSVAEGTETVILTISADPSYTVGLPDSATVNIADNDLAVVSFTLIDADTDQAIFEFDPLVDGAVLNLATLPTTNLNIRANVLGSVGSVKFGYDGSANYKIESAAPYALAGDNNGNYAAWTPTLGSHTLTGTAYSASGAKGTAGIPLTIIFTVINEAPNQAPTVNAGADQIITLPDSASLSGTASDDDLPSNTLTTTWSMFSGPGTVIFGDASALVTTATFSVDGVYVLHLTASDGALSTVDDVSITVNAQAGNAAPVVNAGTDQTITLPNGVSLNGSANDDGLPSNTLAHLWTVTSGPGTVTFTDATALSTSATFSIDGVYVLRLTTSDGELSGFDELTVTVNPQAVNTAPIVNAGADQTLAQPNGADLNGTVTDDGLPTPPNLGVTWSVVSGPGVVSFSNPNAVDTSATFSIDGVYVLRLTASDGELSSFDELTVTVNPEPVNTAPVVNAGTDQTVTLSGGATLDGTVTDDGLPTPPSVTTLWTVISGPGTVTFGDATAVDTTASFSAAGTYTLRLTASDGALEGFDEVSITVNAATNTAPTVNAGTDQTIVFPNNATLDGTVTDDGLPSNTLTSTWTQLFGPGTVTFGNASLIDTTASFSVAGTYTLRLTVSDGELTTTDDIVVKVDLSATQSPFSTNPVYMPGLIQVEDFDNGGQNVSWFDKTAGNSGGVYRTTDVDIEANTDDGGGFSVTNTKSGEWLEYTVEIPTTGLYTIQVRVASAGNGGKFHIEFNGVNKTGSWIVANTGSWQNYVTLTMNNVSLDAGQQVMRLKMETNGGPGITGHFNWIRISQPTVPTANTWVSGQSMPTTGIGEVAAGVIDGKMYIVGEGSSGTFAYDIATDTWTSGLAARPFAGHHHAAEVYNGKLYLIGGIHSGSGKVQIYDPVTNTWTLGADMPFAAGSSATALIDGFIYVAGGVLSNNTTTNLAAKYDPATNTWTSIASMPQGRNHPASATDGVKLYVFGGRDGPNATTNGFDTVQIYDPATNTWVSSDDPGSTIAPLPQARGGMGKAVYFNGEFYIIGGETATGAGATADGVYDRVDIYNPTTNTWRLGPAMPTARHGIFPLLYNGAIYVAGGGIEAEDSKSPILEVLYLT